jgi:cobalt-zinc-cadmium efflux system outer membrane protein
VKIGQRASRLFGVTLVLLSGCAGVSRLEGVQFVQARVMRSGENASHIVEALGREAADARVAELLRSPLTLSASVEIAQLRNPHVMESYARVGLSQADVVAASRISNPIFSGSLITGAGERQAVGQIDQSISDLLLLASRRQLADADYQRNQAVVAQALTDLLREVEAAWYRCVSAGEVARLRTAIAAGAEVSARLAQRFYDAGNISDLELAVTRAAATQAHLATIQAATAARAATYDLQTRMGLQGIPTWSIASELPAPAPTTETPEGLVAAARERRADLRAARQEVMLLDDALRVAKRWRWLGVTEVGVQREREPDGRVLTGPTLALALPLFNQGQAGIGRGEAQLQISQARLQALQASVENTVRLDFEQLGTAREVAETYRESLVPQQALLVKREQELQHFMFIGQFELLLAKQQEYETYQKYLEAVRDYWLARVELSGAVGADLQVDGNAAPSTVGVDAILNPSPREAEHSGHHHGQTHGELPPTEKTQGP